MSEVLRIREMCEDERPREKMMKKGVKSLSDAELLAIMIRTGDKNNNAVTLSSKVLTLSKHGVRGLTDLSLDELCSNTCTLTPYIGHYLFSCSGFNTHYCSNFFCNSCSTYRTTIYWRFSLSNCSS